MNTAGIMSLYHVQGVGMSLLRYMTMSSESTTSFKMEDSFNNAKFHDEDKSDSPRDAYLLLFVA
jgi:hypothetical protein